MSKAGRVVICEAGVEILVHGVGNVQLQDNVAIRVGDCIFATEKAARIIALPQPQPEQLSLFPQGVNDIG